jgi:serine/threonine-protein kinase
MANTDGRKTGIHDVATGKLLANRWQVLDVIGGGGMGVVYRCWDLNLKTTVAVKILNKEFQDDQKIVERFHREVEILIKSAHPNIAVIHACSSREDEPPVFLVMEFLNGPTLKMVLDESPDRRLHPQRVLRVGTQVLDALDAVHARGIIHRDLKPENVFVLRTGPGRRNIDVAKVIDFGIAKASENQGGADGASLTQIGTVVGTPYYMAPEQCLGAQNTDHRADIYAMGVMLYEMTTGRLPFDAPNREDIMVAHLSETPRPPREIDPDISPELEAVILQAMAKKARDRFADALAMSEALEEAILEDKTYYRDSQRVSPVEGRISALPLRAETPEAPRRPSPPPEPPATPTNLLKPRTDIGLAQTITPTDLDREARAVAEAAAAAEEAPAGPAPEDPEEAALPPVISTPDITMPPIGGTPAGDWIKGARVPLDAAVAHLKNFGVWIGEIPRQTKIFILAGAGLAILLIVLAAMAARGCDGKTSMADAGRLAETTVAETEADVYVPPAKQPDVVVIRIPVPTPPVPLPAPGDATTETPDETTDATPAEETDYTTEVSLPDLPEIPPETNLGGPPNGYEELIAKARSARNWRTAVARLEEATRLWPEGPDAWETLGDILVTQRGQTERARAAYARCLELLPQNALSRRARLEGKIRGLR